jgi:hypothetical protein
MELRGESQNNQTNTHSDTNGVLDLKTGLMHQSAEAGLTWSNASE